MSRGFSPSICKPVASMSDSPDSDGRLKGFRGAGPSATSRDDDSAIKEQDRLLPIANVGRIMKQILPPNAKISKEAKETMQECVSEFISFVTGEASDKCRKEKRKTVNGDDVCWALNTLGFDDYVEPMRRYLQKYRETEGDRAAPSGGNIRDDVRGDEQGHFMFNAMDRHHNSPSSSRRQF